MHVVQCFKPQIWTVGFYDPDGKWHPVADHASMFAAFEQIHFLNGGNPCQCPFRTRAEGSFSKEVYHGGE